MADYTQAELDELRRNYARGVAEVQKGDERIKFRSMAEMRAIIREVEASMSSTPATRQHYPSMNRGT